MTYLRSNKQVSRIGLWGRSMGAVTRYVESYSLAYFHHYTVFLDVLIGRGVDLRASVHSLGVLSLVCFPCPSSILSFIF